MTEQEKLEAAMASLCFAKAAEVLPFGIGIHDAYDEHVMRPGLHKQAGMRRLIQPQKLKSLAGNLVNRVTRAANTPVASSPVSSPPVRSTPVSSPNIITKPSRSLYEDKAWRTLARRLHEGGIAATPSELQVAFLENGLISGDKIKSLMETAARNYDVPTVNAGHIINPNIAHKTNSGSISRMLAGLGFKRYMGTSFDTLKLSPDVHDVLKPIYYSIIPSDRYAKDNVRTLFDKATSAIMPGVKWTDEMMTYAPRSWDEVPGLSNTAIQNLISKKLPTPIHFSAAVRNMETVADLHRHNLQLNRTRSSGSKRTQTDITVPSIRHYKDPFGRHAEFDYDLVKRSFDISAVMPRLGLPQ